MVTDVNETLWRSFCRTYKNKSSHCTPETNIMLHFTLDVNKKFKKKKQVHSKKKKKLQTMGKEVRNGEFRLPDPQDSAYTEF